MNRKKYTLSLLALIIVFICGISSSAYAAKVMIQNEYNKKLWIAFCYKDRTNGKWTTEGWWGLDSNKYREVKLDKAHPEESVYYYASGSGSDDATNYYDSRDYGGDTMTRYFRDGDFKFDFPGKPSSGRNIKKKQFLECSWDNTHGGYFIEIDSSDTRK